MLEQKLVYSLSLWLVYSKRLCEARGSSGATAQQFLRDLLTQMVSVASLVVDLAPLLHFQPQCGPPLQLRDHPPQELLLQ